ncbi:MAG: type II toxin-antitoxin system RelE/ParE family toxin [Bacteroidales bacterium]|nr:type II toxin-antitoxin system RelE/ParE family toxin [Bacteroidales bacterium]
MVTRKIIWSLRAKNDLFEILDFYYKRNGNASYSKKLNHKVKKTVSLLRKFPRLGIKTDEKNVRAIIEGDYIIFYEIKNTTIEIIMIWDSRKNPDGLVIKKSPLQE